MSKRLGGIIGCFVNSTASRLLGFKHPSTQHRYSYSSKDKAHSRVTKVG